MFNYTKKYIMQAFSICHQQLHHTRITLAFICTWPRGIQDTKKKLPGYRYLKENKNFIQYVKTLNEKPR